MKHPLSVRCQHAWAVLSGRIYLPTDPATMEQYQAMSDLDNAVARIQASSARLLTLNASNAKAAADAEAAQATSEAAAVTALNATSDSIDAVAPVPPVASETVAQAEPVTGQIDPATGLPVA